MSRLLNRPDADRGLVEIMAPTVHVFTSHPIAQIANWRVVPGQELDADRAEDRGCRSSFPAPDFDDSGWYRAGRINDVPFGFPTWEPDSFVGCLWFRAPVTTPSAAAPDEPIHLMFGSPIEPRELEWSVYVEGTQVTTTPVRAGLLDLTIDPGAPGHDVLSRPGRHLLAIHLRVSRMPAHSSRLREAEGWKRVDPFCYQQVSWGRPWTSVDDWIVDVPDGTDRLVSPEHGLTVDYEITDDADDTVVALVLRNTQPHPVDVSHVGLTHVRWPQHQLVAHPEGAFAASTGGAFVGAAHPGQLTIVTGDVATPTLWVGTELAAGQSLSLPPVVIGARGADGPRSFRQYLAEHGPRRGRQLAVYDPYGWYQISHASEPKTELSDELIGRIDDALGRFAEVGVRFDYLSLDCGWNDPDDLRRFNAQNMPSGGEEVRQLARRRDLGLMLWASPSDGPRAFRHELGMDNPGLDDCKSQNPIMTWRLCPAAPRWRDTFRSALLQHVENNQVRGFKLDGIDVWCASATHGHRPGIWSVYATTQALISTLSAVREAGCDLLMLYWGVRSPWWLLWADTLYDRRYLVEAAAPSGARSWDLRLSVASSQDIGHQADWDTIPASMQDSLGVWISDTAWASWQGAENWADALTLDIGRGGRLTQLWGDLDALLSASGEGQDVARVLSLAERLARATDSDGEPILGPAWADECYGYLWHIDSGAIAFLANSSGVMRTTELPPVPGIRSLNLLYRTAGHTGSAELSDGRVRVDQAPGTVLVLELTGSGGPTRVGTAPQSARVLSCDLVDVASVALGPGDAELIRAAYIGRGPQLEALLATTTDDEVAAESMAAKLQPADRSLRRLTQNWRAELDLDRPGQVAVMACLHQHGRAWHNDQLHRLVRLEVRADGEQLDGSVLPYRMHEQAGSWSWMSHRSSVPAGRYRVEVWLDAVVPDSVEVSVDVWARIPDPGARQPL